MHHVFPFPNFIIVHISDHTKQKYYINFQDRAYTFIERQIFLKNKNFKNINLNFYILLKN